MSLKQGILLLAIICVVATAMVVRVLGLIDQTQLQAFIEQAGIWAPVVYIAVYIVATSLLLPSTALNITGGAIFGPVWGVVWTSVGAILAAILSFLFTRTIGHEMVNRKFGNRWPSMDEEVRRNGLSYIFAIRLLPIFPYGLVNYAAGLTSISFKSYLLGTIPGTVMGVFPFVLIGSSGLKAMQTGKVIPLVVALALTGLLTVAATWYRRRRLSQQSKGPAVEASPK